MGRLLLKWTVMPSHRPYNPLAEAIRAREAALTRFGERERELDCHLDPATAIAGIGWLYEMLPEPARHRDLDASGVQALHRAISVLSASTAR